MPVPPEKRVRFFVYIIETPSAVDLYQGRHEGTMLEQSLRLNQIPCAAHLAISSEAFGAAVKIGLPEAMKAFPNLVPIIHISAHGDSKGLVLSDSSRVDWHELKTLLQPVNKALNRSLIVCMSCCEGYSGVQMAITLDQEDYPFFALVGNHKSPTWAETSVAFSTFYHLLNKGHYVTEAVSAMNSAAGVSSFCVERAEDSRKYYIEYCNKHVLQTAQESLEQSASSEPKPETAKYAQGSGS